MFTNSAGAAAEMGSCAPVAFVLDQNPTHRQKMRAALAAYSPCLNPVEYLIRLRLLYHAAPSQNQQQVQQRLAEHVHLAI